MITPVMFCYWGLNYLFHPSGHIKGALNGHGFEKYNGHDKINGHANIKHNGCCDNKHNAHSKESNNHSVANEYTKEVSNRSKEGEIYSHPKENGGSACASGHTKVINGDGGCKLNGFGSVDPIGLMGEVNGHELGSPKIHNKVARTTLLF